MKMSNCSKPDTIFGEFWLQKHINELVQCQLSPGRILYQSKIVYYGIVTSLLQHNTIFITQAKCYDSKNMLIIL